MTKQEYINWQSDWDEKIEATQREKIKLRDRYLKEHAQFNEGDKVEVVINSYSLPFGNRKVIPEQRILAYVGKITDKYMTGNIEYNFIKCKKDGTKGSQSAGIYNYDRIELIEKAKNLTP